MNNSEVRPLGDVAEFLSGFAWKAKQFSDEPKGMPVIRIQNVGGDASTEFKYWPDTFADRFVISKGDLLLTLSGSFRTAVWSGPNALLNQRIVKVTPQVGTDTQWLFYALEEAMARIAKMGRHALVSNVALSDLKELRINVPPLEEQKRIAQILDQADTLRRLRTRALDKLTTLGQAIFHEMFGDPGSNPKGWPVVEFGTSVENCDSQRVPIKQADRDKRSGPYPYYGSVGIIDDIDDFRFEGEHLLVSEDGKHLQSRTRPIACIATGKFWVNNHAHVLRDNGRADLYFLRTFLETSSIENHISGIDQIKLNRKSMDKIPVPLPPRADQDRFRAMILSVGKQRLKMEEHSDQTGKLFASLQHRAFRGEL